MKTLQLTLLTLIIMTVCIGSLFAGGFALSGVGSRATALGGAFRGLSDDASAMYWNPAGLGFMDENSIGLGGTFILPTAEWENNGPYFPTIPGYQNKKYKAETSLRPFPNLFATMAKQPDLKYGIGLFVPYGLGTTWNAYESPSQMLTTAGMTNITWSPGFPENEMLSKIAIIDLHPSVAFQVMPNLSAGAGISVLYGTIDLAKVQFSSAATGNLPTTSDMSGSGIGFGGNLGIIYKPMENLSVGLSGKIASDIKMKGDIEANTWIPAPVSPVAMKVGGKSDIETTLKLPSDIGIGISYKLMPNWKLNMDYSYTMWERLDKVVIDIDTPITVSPTPGAPQLTGSEIIFDWENTSRISLGTEYTLPCGSEVRLGFYFDETPIPNETQIITLSDISDKISSNIGLGRSFGNITVDANFQYVMFSERKVETQGTTNMAGVYTANSISGNIGLTYKF